MINFFSLFKKKDKLVKYNSISFVEKETKHEFLQVIPNSSYDKNELTKVGDASNG